MRELQCTCIVYKKYEILFIIFDICIVFALFIFLCTHTFTHSYFFHFCNAVISQKEKESISASERKSSSHHNDDTSTFYNPIAADVSYSMRHVEESWHHLMRSDDIAKFKQIAVCNFDFLLAAVSSNTFTYTSFHWFYEKNLLLLFIYA